MGGSAAWQNVLVSPSPGQHIAQLYSEPGFFLRAVGQFVREGLRRGDAIILMATAVHRHAITLQLEKDAFMLDDLRRRGQLTILDAAECLAGLLVDDMPDRGRFRTLIDGAVAATRAAGYRNVRVFGEMVDVLRRTSAEATMRLEELWNEAVAEQQFSLLCSYSLDNFDRRIYGGLLQRVSARHSELIPVEDYPRLERAVQNAYEEAFGPAGEADRLRRGLVAHYARPAVMPDAQAAILAVQEFVPTVADILLERVRHHYGSRWPSVPASDHPS